MDRLIALQRAIEARAAPDKDASFVDRLCVTKVGSLAYLDFYGDPFGESFGDLLDILGESAIANAVASIDLRGPDEGSNGTRNWDLSAIAESAASFPNMKRLCIEQTKPSDHNRTIVARSYEETASWRRCLLRRRRLKCL